MITTEIHKTKNRKIIQKINEISLYFEKINKIINVYLHWLRKEEYYR